MAPPRGDYSRALYSRPRKYPLTGPTGHSVHIWHVVNKQLGWDRRLTLATSLWNSEKLGNLWQSKGFDKWDLIGISRIKDLWVKDEILLFASLQQQYHLADTEHYRYLQIQHALHTHLTSKSPLLDASPLEDRLLNGHLPEKTISLICKKLINNMEDTLQSLKEKWTRDGLELDEEDWREAVSSPREVAVQARLHLVQLKILHRIYTTGPGLVRMGNTDSGECRCGCGEVGTFIHILWECAYIQSYWHAIHHTLREVLTTDLQPEARRCLLNIWEPTDPTSYTKQWATLAVMIAKRNIVQNWGAHQPPTLGK